MTEARPTGGHEPLAIVGSSCLFPKAASVGEFWSNIRRGVDAIDEIPSTHWQPAAYFDADPKRPDMTYARRGGFLSPVPFDPLEFGIAPSNLEAIDTSQLLGLVASKRALEDAGYGAADGKTCDRSRIGCILGVTGAHEMVIPLGARLGHPKWRQALKDAGVPDDVAADVIERIGESYVPWRENPFPGLLGNVVGGRIPNRLNLRGPNCVVDAACASSLSAVRYPEVVLEDGSRVFDSMQFSEESYETKQLLRDTKSRLRDLIMELPAEQKQVLIMRHYLEMSFQEIADRTGVTINKALGRMRYALINLRKKMIKNNIAYDKDLYPKRSDQVSIPRELGRGDEGD